MERDTTPPIELTREAHSKLRLLLDKDPQQRRHVRLFVEAWG
jgi:hypothetical protein